mmetsp:Transcript_15310/g.40662  ORF Transcript_15310/g.40662 Transcript_15310/m.40662 type:complete len:361 (-) Transcript_15310:25-1107(-)
MLPVAPPNLQPCGICLRRVSCPSKRSMKTLISLAKFVGEAGCPWVLASIETSHSGSLERRVDIKFSSSGRKQVSSEFLIISGFDVLLMSWLVSPKCTNSLKGWRPSASNCSLMKYSTALTSWLVTFSVALTFSACSSVRFAGMALSFSAMPAGRPLPSGSSSMRARKYSISMWTRYRISPNSEKKPESDLVPRRYRPSTGETAASSLRPMSVGVVSHELPAAPSLRKPATPWVGARALPLTMLSMAVLASMPAAALALKLLCRRTRFRSSMATVTAPTCGMYVTPGRVDSSSFSSMFLWLATFTTVAPSFTQAGFSLYLSEGTPRTTTSAPRTCSSRDSPSVSVGSSPRWKRNVLLMSTL